MNRFAIFAISAALSASSVSAVVVDGTVDASYGPAVAVQNTQTVFGNSDLGQPLYANGSEIDSAFACVEGGVLYLTLTGNLESNFNKLELFIDSQAGGQHSLRGDNADIDFNGLNRMGTDNLTNGLTFENGFAADYYLTVRHGYNGSSGHQIFADFATLPTTGGGTSTSGSSTVDTGVLNSGLSGIQIALNSSNTGGVNFGTAVESGAGVTTGFEYAIPLSAIGNPATGSTISLTAFINGGNHDSVANQVLGGLGGGAALGDPRDVNFSNLAGIQSFNVLIPEPTTVAAIAGAGLVTLRRRK